MCRAVGISGRADASTEHLIRRSPIRGAKNVVAHHRVRRRTRHRPGQIHGIGCLCGAARPHCCTEEKQQESSGASPGVSGVQESVKLALRNRSALRSCAGRRTVARGGREMQIRHFTNTCRAKHTSAVRTRRRSAARMCFRKRDPFGRAFSAARGESASSPDSLCDHKEGQELLW